MKKRNNILKALAIALAVAAFVVSVVTWRGCHGTPLQTLVEVESRSVYEVTTAEGDTLYMAPPTIPSGSTAELMLRFDYEADSAMILRRTKGFCIDRDAEVLTVAPVLREEMGGDTLQQLLKRELTRLEKTAQWLHRHVAELDYYARTHSAVDAGYTEVMTFGSAHRSRSAHLDSTLVLLRHAARSKATQARLLTTYRVNGVPVRMDRQQGGLVHLLPFSRKDSIGRLDSDLYMFGMMPWVKHVSLERTDSAGNRFSVETVDSVNEESPGGFRGEWYGTDGSYYRGDFNPQLERHGMGFAVDDKLVKYGIWRQNQFVGEQMLYTSDRIYGIDISRYQHELKRPVVSTVTVKNRKGRRKKKTVRTKKVGIAWSNLRITYLGPKAQAQVQGEVDYPVSFVFIKCTQGTTIKSDYYAADLAAASRQGIPVAPYHFFSHKASGSAQARYFLKFARLSQTTMPPMLDVEPTTAQIAAMGGVAGMFREIMAWMRIVEQNCGRKPVLYVSQTFVNKYMDKAPRELLDHDVWIARYGEYRPYVKLLFWQLTPYGRVRGINGEVDINVFNGSREDFDKWRKG